MSALIRTTPLAEVPYDATSFPEPKEVLRFLYIYEDMEPLVVSSPAKDKSPVLAVFAKNKLKRNLRLYLIDERYFAVYLDVFVDKDIVGIAYRDAAEELTPYKVKEIIMLNGMAQEYSSISAVFGEEFYDELRELDFLYEPEEEHDADDN